MLQAANPHNNSPANICLVTGPANPCSYSSMLYLPTFSDDQRPTTEFTHAVPGAGDVWTALLNLESSPFHGPHAVPVAPFATRTQLLPNASPGLYAIAGDLSLLPPGCLIMTATDMNESTMGV